ncbi:hypothetical protein ABH992_003283 [Bradyrhizobium yuanmingense]|uniref:Uncharacterized protein n=1 Tax=Bradyrhizobium yuanmingense TaxID=108015 RepID=A0ABV4GG12_9BRAD
MAERIKDEKLLAGITSAQTPKLLREYKKQFGTETANIAIIERVMLMTPENIHLNYHGIHATQEVRPCDNLIKLAVHRTLPGDTSEVEAIGNAELVGRPPLRRQHSLPRQALRRPWRHPLTTCPCQ